MQIPKTIYIDFFYIKTIYGNNVALLKRFLDVLRWVKRFN